MLLNLYRTRLPCITTVLYYANLIGLRPIHGAIVAATLVTIVCSVGLYKMRRSRRSSPQSLPCRDHRRDSRPVYTLQAIVGAMNTCLIEQPTDDCRGNDWLPRRSRRVYALSVFSHSTAGGGVMGDSCLSLPFPGPRP